MIDPLSVRPPTSSSGGHEWKIFNLRKVFFKISFNYEKWRKNICSLIFSELWRSGRETSEFYLTIFSLSFFEKWWFCRHGNADWHRSTDPRRVSWLPFILRVWGIEKFFFNVFKKILRSWHFFEKTHLFRCWFLLMTPVFLRRMVTKNKWVTHIFSGKKFDEIIWWDDGLCDRPPDRPPTPSLGVMNNGCLSEESFF